MQKIVVDSSRLDPRYQKYDERYGRVNHVNIHAGDARPRKTLPVENPRGERIGTAHRVRDYGESDPRAKGFFQYVIEWITGK